MFGGPDAAAGIIPRAMAQILASVQQHRDSGWTYDLRASFLEIYNESVRDLLCSPEECEGRQYKISTGDSARSEVSELRWETVANAGDLERIVETAQLHKTTARTDMNEMSSRSHTIFSLRITGSREGASGQVTTLQGCLNLVDLAGSERLSKSNATGQQLKETQAINKSLSALSDVFVAISKKQAHIPYRNSKLTYLLQPCLSGDGKALVIANLSPDEGNAHESLCSLRFASMVSSCELGKAAKHVKTEASRAAPQFGADLNSTHMSSINDISAISLDISEAPSVMSASGLSRAKGLPSRTGTPSKPPVAASSPRVGTPSRLGGTPSKLAGGGTPSKVGTPGRVTGKTVTTPKKPLR